MPLVPFCAALVALPWLWPFTSGPMAGTQPWLVSAGVAALLLGLWPAADAREGVRAAAWGWLVAAVLSSGIALLQYFNLETPLFPWVNMAVPGQAFGNLRQPNQLATLLVMGGLALAWLVRTRALPRAALALAALLLMALAASASRTGLAQLLLVGVLAMLWGRGQRRWLAALWTAAMALYAAAALALPWLLQWTEGQTGRAMIDRLTHGESTCGSRLILWRNVLHLIVQRPWAGWGWGELDYAHYITLYDGPRFCYILDNAHNLPLHLAVELGVPAALLICGLLAWLTWRARPWAERDATRQLAWAVLAVIALHSLVEYPLWYGPFQIATAICVWLLWRTRPGAAIDSSVVLPGQAESRVGAVSALMDSRLRGNGGQESAARGLAVVRWGVAALMLAAVGYAAWDYQRISQLFKPVAERSATYRDDALEQAQRSWLFADTVLFAELTSQSSTRENAAWMLPAALKTLHYSPEPRVIQRVIESATWLGQDQPALAHLARYKAAFPREAAQWSADNGRATTAVRQALEAASSSVSALPSGNAASR